MHSEKGSDTLLIGSSPPSNGGRKVATSIPSEFSCIIPVQHGICTPSRGSLRIGIVGLVSFIHFFLSCVDLKLLWQRAPKATRSFRNTMGPNCRVCLLWYVVRLFMGVSPADLVLHGVHKDPTKQEACTGPRPQNQSPSHWAGVGSSHNFGI